MLLRVVAVGTRMPAWVEQAVAEYSGRLPAEVRLEWREVRAAQRGRSADEARWLREEARPVAILVGGPDGLDPALKATADETLRLSSLTLPHPLVRVLLAEQLYRAWSINAGHPYHRA
jgi:23S rRNA (pseudouridine1915-N3)-methyltransferase